ncbi:hypothetical protein EAH78_31305 [Pseudomonas arsenicoxydans]|jgi:hypothetical protein|uniref:Uncharacterized protein n=1 Tax=Pseudomonas arsenicoxydans TaxID=702115 RepID=A0A502GTM9_9PSED|nr:hypothetical protein EAH78_31305 [Pseudomonas arsenicoxydans]
MHQKFVVDELSEAERQLLIKGLRALRRERGLAWNVACDIATERKVKAPPLSQYGITEIEQLARRFGGTARHWTDE